MQYLIQEAPVSFPDKSKFGFEVSPVAIDLIHKLLEKDKSKRLGANGDIDEVMSHPFFAPLDIP
jgi:serine/threonine protein kinase